MDADELLDMVQKDQEREWCQSMKETWYCGLLERWLQDLLSQQKPCKTFTRGNGSYNYLWAFTIDDGSKWIVRFPIGGKVAPSLMDEKIAAEVEALTIVKTQTTIPVPSIRTWGLAADNSLGLGPFMILSWIEGVNLSWVIGKAAADLDDADTEKLPDLTKKTNLTEVQLDLIYRQYANFMLQLFNIDFEALGSLPNTVTGFPFPKRPLTWKAHEIFQGTNLDIFGARDQGFDTTTEYFTYVHGQDMHQMLDQRNACTGIPTDAMRYDALTTLGVLLPQLVEKDYDIGPFKLICDDLGFQNLIVKDDQDLTIVGVIDMEWSYIGLFASTPWWLLGERLVNLEHWDEVELEQRVLESYQYNLALFMRILREEETKRHNGNGPHELSVLMQRSWDSGSAWMHMLLSAGFLGETVLPFKGFISHLKEKWTDTCMNLPQILNNPDYEVQRGDWIKRKKATYEAYDVEKKATLEIWQEQDRLMQAKYDEWRPERRDSAWAGLAWITIFPNHNEFELHVRIWNDIFPNHNR